MNLTGWRKSRRSSTASTCVEVGQAPGVVGIRDTKNRDGGTLMIPRPLFDVFLTAVKNGRLR